jgi:hypothetical protein
MVFCCQGRPHCQDRPCRQDRPFHQDRPLTIKVESRGISWNLVESRPVMIKVGFQSGSASCR